MNQSEQDLADYILKQSLTNSKLVINYLTLMKAVKLRIEIEKLSNGNAN